MVKTFKQFINSIDNKAEPVILEKSSGIGSIASPLAGGLGLFAGGAIAKRIADVIAPEYSQASYLAGAALGGIGGWRWGKRMTSGQDVDLMKHDYIEAVKRGDPQEKLDSLYSDYEKAVHAHNKLVTPLVGKKRWISYGRFETDDRRRLYPKNMTEYR